MSKSFKKYAKLNYIFDKKADFLRKKILKKCWKFSRFWGLLFDWTPHLFMEVRKQFADNSD